MGSNVWMYSAVKGAPLTGKKVIALEIPGHCALAIATESNKNRPAEVQNGDFICIPPYYFMNPFLGLKYSAPKMVCGTSLTRGFMRAVTRILFSLFCRLYLCI